MQKLNCTLALFALASLLATVSSDQLWAQATEEAADVQEIMMEVGGLIQEGDWEGGLEILETAMEKDPQGYELMVRASQVYTGYGVQMASDDRKAANKPLRRGAALMRKVHESKDELSDSEQEQLAICIYNEACCAAIDGDADATFTFLKEAAAAGFDDVELLESDSDFKLVKDDPRFAKFATALSDDDHDNDHDDDDHDHDDDDHDHDNDDDDDDDDDDA